MSRLLTDSFMAAFCVVTGLAFLTFGAWSHHLLGTMLGGGLIGLGTLFSWTRHKKEVGAAVEGERRRWQGETFKLANDAAEMLFAVFETAWPQLRAKKIEWGKDENGDAEGLAIEVKDRFRGDWAIDIAGRGRCEVYLYRTPQPGTSCLSKDRQYKPAQWRQSLIELTSHPKAKVR